VVIVLVGWLFLDGLSLVVLAAGIAFLEELITAGLVIVRATRKATNESEEAMKIKQRSIRLVLIALGLLVGFIILVPMAELVGLIFAGLSILLMFAAGFYSYKAGKAKQAKKSKESGKEKSNRPYLVAMLSGWLAMLSVLIGLFLLFTASPVWIAILVFGLSVLAGVYTILRFLHYRKHRGEIAGDASKEDTSFWLSLSLFFAIVGLFLDLVIGALSLLLFWAFGGF
jgi:hypothetical protein